MFAITAHGLPTFAAGFTGFVRRELVRATLLVGCPASLTGNLALPCTIHRGESAHASAVSAIAVINVVSHRLFSFCHYRTMGEFVKPVLRRSPFALYPYPVLVA
jgi:hypothetical protein